MSIGFLSTSRFRITAPLGAQLAYRFVVLLPRFTEPSVFA
jgi:hypothetical protein